jgi:hypothetical protein
MGRRHPVAAAIEDQARQQARRLGVDRQGALVPPGREAVLNSLPNLRFDDRFVLAGVDLVLVGDFASESALALCRATSNEWASRSSDASASPTSVVEEK